MNQGMKSRNTTIAILSALLVAALISGSMLYREHLKTKQALQVTEKELLNMNEKLIPSNNALIADLQKKLRMIQSNILNTEGRKAVIEANLRQLQNKYDAILSQREELKNARGKISELKNMVGERDQLISQLQGNLKNLESEFEKEKRMHKSLRSELSSKNSLVASLQKEISRKQSHMLRLKEEITKGKRETERLRLQLSDLEGKREIAESEMGQLKSTYEKLVSDLHKQLKNHEVAIKTYKERISVTFVDNILFDSGKATISAAGRRILRKVGEALSKVEDKQIRIIGHTDDIAIMQEYRYKFPTNWELSTARAVAVVRYFQEEMGLDPENLVAVGRSFYQTIASNETEKGRAQNRRVNIIIGPKVR